MSKAGTLLAEIEALPADAEGWRALPSLPRAQGASRGACLRILEQGGVIERRLVNLGRAGSLALVKIVPNAKLDEAWPAATEAGLAELWATGLSTAEIGRKLGVTKNAVIGKAHRMGLSRQSPIIRRVPKVAPYAGRTCQFIEAEPTPDDSCKCGAPVVHGRPYCPEHFERAYTKTPPDNSQKFAAHKPSDIRLRAVA